MDAKTTGQFISFLRKEKGMTQKQLSEKLNVSDKAISRWETGRGFPDIESLQALSCEFSVFERALKLNSK
jgi:transcriptional regulator with XRE-family HTH domain